MLFLAGWAWGTAQAATDEGRYIEVTGTSEVEIVPEIHYIIEIKEYFAEEFDGKSKEEDYRTKVPLAQIEERLRETLREAGVPDEAVRTQEIGDYWRESGREFLVSKRFDLTLTDFKQIDRIVRHVDTKGIRRVEKQRHAALPSKRKNSRLDGRPGESRLFSGGIGPETWRRGAHHRERKQRLFSRVHGTKQRKLFRRGFFRWFSYD